jgi:hypothetical protein
MKNPTTFRPRTFLTNTLALATTIELRREVTLECRPHNPDLTKMPNVPPIE